MLLSTVVTEKTSSKQMNVNQHMNVVVRMSPFLRKLDKLDMMKGNSSNREVRTIP